MGSTLSVCGLGAARDDAHNKQHARTYEREKVRELLAHHDRARSLSVATDTTSVASILSNSDRLIPDAFMPVDIQVVSQRRVRPASGSAIAASGAPPKTSSHYYSNSAHANAAFLRYMTTSTSATASDSVPMSSYQPGAGKRKAQTAAAADGGSSDSGAFPEDDGAPLSSRSARRSGNHSHLSARELVRGY